MRSQRPLLLEEVSRENSITGLDRERKGVVERGHHLQIPIMGLSQPREADPCPRASSTPTELGDLSRVLHSPEPQFLHLKDGNMEL